MKGYKIVLILGFLLFYQYFAQKTIIVSISKTLPYPFEKKNVLIFLRKMPPSKKKNASPSPYYHGFV